MEKLILISVLSLVTTMAWSQEYTQQIEFKKGAFSATYKGYISTNDHTFYYFNANDGQFLNTHLKSLNDNASISYFEDGLYGAGITIGKGTEYNTTLKNSGQHMIAVYCDHGKSCEYKLFVTIQ